MGMPVPQILGSFFWNVWENACISIHIYYTRVLLTRLSPSTPASTRRRLRAAPTNHHPPHTYHTHPFLPAPMYFHAFHSTEMATPSARAAAAKVRQQHEEHRRLQQQTHRQQPSASASAARVPGAVLTPNISSPPRVGRRRGRSRQRERRGDAASRAATAGDAGAASGSRRRGLSPASTAEGRRHGAALLQQPPPPAPAAGGHTAMQPAPAAPRAIPVAAPAAPELSMELPPSPRRTARKHRKWLAERVHAELHDVMTRASDSVREQIRDRQHRRGRRRSRSAGRNATVPVPADGVFLTPLQEKLRAAQRRFVNAGGVVVDASGRVLRASWPGPAPTGESSNGSSDNDNGAGPRRRRRRRRRSRSNSARSRSNRQRGRSPHARGVYVPSTSAAAHRPVPPGNSLLQDYQTVYFGLTNRAAALASQTQKEALLMQLGAGPARLQLLSRCVSAAFSAFLPVVLLRSPLAFFPSH